MAPFPRRYRFLEKQEDIGDVDDFYSYGENASFYHSFSSRWFEDFHDILKDRPIRARELRPTVRSLSAPIIVDDSCDSVGGGLWNLVTRFTHLQRLDLLVSWKYCEPFETSEAKLFPFSTLKDVKLYGYFPGGFIQHIMRSAATLESLELCLSHEPTGSTTAADRFNKRQAVFANLHQIQQANPMIHPEVDGVAPVPLMWMTTELSSFPHLGRLHFCHSIEHDTNAILTRSVSTTYTSHNRSYSESASLSHASVQVMERLILAAKSSLRSLTFDQRPAVSKALLD